jgi:hypothetical protein
VFTRVVTRGPGRSNGYNDIQWINKSPQAGLSIGERENGPAEHEGLARSAMAGTTGGYLLTVMHSRSLE